MQPAAIKHAIETTLADLRNALRHLRRAPLLASLTILTLGLGIGATTAIFSLVNAMLLEDLPLRDGEELLFVGHDLTGGNLGRVPLTAAGAGRPTRAHDVVRRYRWDLVEHHDDHRRKSRGASDRSRHD